MYFKINKNEKSSSPNRDGHNGLLLMSRIQDGNNLYYAGIRVDGQAVIKKKQNGIYYTLSSNKTFSGVYNRNLNPNLLPKNIWIGLKSETYTLKDETIIKLYMDVNRTGNWKLITQTRDFKKSQGYPILTSGFAGIRTDFMDVEFDDYKLENI
ncbi:hypothetical protein COU57_00100 [Candidatus Pacearchaeota archaeon CG10_big_fil_rev_8_21_14_0_10_32_14]|nr:MAG: hypothetical protein COU57_00100 [Candidatus Pacearchaeota archaeon CG10_big_fil_rev_8_21_14_0_10_32_14]